MLSRREVLIGAAAAGAAALVRGGTTALASASQPSTPVNFDVPPGACDTHTHVFGDRQRFQEAVDRIKRRGKWHIQVYTRLSVIEGIKDQVMAAPMPVVFDHFGGAQAALGVSQPGFDTLLNLVRTGKAYVKISAPYRSSTKPPDYEDVAPLAKALIGANPQRILWGSDWPHPASPVAHRPVTEITPLWQVDDGRILNQLPLWAPDAALRKIILVTNHAKLYGF